MLHIAGGNGAGKTTLLRALLGLHREWEGEVTWTLDGPPAYVSHAVGLHGGLTLAENLRWHGALRGRRLADGDISRALAAFGLEGLGQRLCGRLSQGQRKRGNLARLLVAPASCWALDEPAALLDAEGLAALHRLMQQHREAGGGILITSHQPLGMDGVQTLELG